MKLEPLFKSQDNKLYFLDGTEADLSKSLTLDAKDCNSSAPDSPFYCINLSWTLTGLDEDSYNEELLAALREFLKELEEKKAFAFINPVCDAPCQTELQKENLTLSMKHAARRIKDCTSVIGFAIPQESSSDFFIEELSAKHKQYIFLSKDQKLLENKEIVRF